VFFTIVKGLFWAKLYFFLYIFLGFILGGVMGMAGDNWDYILWFSPFYAFPSLSCLGDFLPQMDKTLPPGGVG